MKILILNSYISGGGAARAAFRLYEALKQQNVIIKFVSFNDKKLNHFWGFFPSIFRKIDNLLVKFFKSDSNLIFSNGFTSSLKLKLLIRTFKPDIIHIHWINHGFLSIKDIRLIKVPIVVTMHDMWFFTGGCHNTNGCDNFVSECIRCPQLNKSIIFDFSHYNQIKKQKLFAEFVDRITFIGLSSWLVSAAKSSSILKKNAVINLPNPIDTNFYLPANIDFKVDVPKGKKCLVFGALNATNDPNKGFEYLKKALNLLDPNSYFFVIFGKVEPLKLEGLKLDYISLGGINYDSMMRDVYNLADIFIVPSLQENLSNTIMESLSCGTPVVAFNIGGNGDMIEHMTNGYLARPFDCQDLADGISYVANHEHYSLMCNNSRNSIVNKFSYDVISLKYLKLYSNLVNQ